MKVRYLQTLSLKKYPMQLLGNRRPMPRAQGYRITRTTRDKSISKRRNTKQEVPIVRVLEEKSHLVVTLIALVFG